MTAIALVFFALVAFCNAASLSTKLSPRPIDVRRAKPGEMAFMVSLQYDYVDVRYCNGILLSKDYVLTTCGCLDNKVGFQTTIIIGTTDLNDRKSHTTAAHVIYHKEYNPAASFIHNIALIKLKTPMPKSDLISYAKLPDPEEVLDLNDKTEVVGWGLIKENDRDQSNYLQILDVLPINKDNCSYIYQPKHLTIYGSQVCAFRPPGEKYGCERQGGSALISGGKVFGILSYQRDCVEGSSPTVYERTAYYLEWIKKNTENKDTNSSIRHVPTILSSYGAMLFITLSSLLILPNNLFN